MLIWAVGTGAVMSGAESTLSPNLPTYCAELNREGAVLGPWFSFHHTPGGHTQGPGMYWEEPTQHLPCTNLQIWEEKVALHHQLFQDSWMGGNCPPFPIHQCCELFQAAYGSCQSWPLCQKIVEASAVQYWNRSVINTDTNNAHIWECGSMTHQLIQLVEP